MMKRNFKFYVLIWAIAVAIFNLFCFLPEGNIDRLEESGWIGYGFIIVAFLCQLACAYYALGAGNAQKTFYRVSLLDASYTVLFVMWAVGSICMLINIFPIWFATLICMVALLINLVAVIKGVTAASYVERIDKNVKTKTWFIKSLTVNAEGMITRAQSPEVASEAKKVYEVVRYSDPMSSDALANVEGQITLRFNAFSDAVAANNLPEVQRLANELIILLGDRNKTCKLLK